MGRTIETRGLALALFCLAGCIVDQDLGASEQAIARPGPWQIPSDTSAIGDTQHVVYTGAGLWNEGQDCAGGMRPGAVILRNYLRDHFPQITSIGGYNCRRNTGSPNYMSIHAVGRALDVMIPKSSNSADNDLGDPVGNWLIENAEIIGIQYIIWDEWTWMAARTPGQKGRMYTGPNPHHDHLHVELSAAAGERTSDWFSALVSPPSQEGCVAIPRDGRVVDDLDPCVQLFGAAAYWRIVLEEGYGGSLVWTNAWQSASPSNWARYNLTLDEEGEYEVAVFLSAGYAVHASTRYTLRHAGEETTLYVDQGAEAPAEGGAWVSLGVFDFAEGDDQWVAVYDNEATSVPPQQHITVDALRLLRLGTTPPEEEVVDEPEAMGPGEEPDPDLDSDGESLENDASGRDASGCTIAVFTGFDGRAGAIWLVAGVLLAVLRARRCSS